MKRILAHSEEETALSYNLIYNFTLNCGQGKCRHVLLYYNKEDCLLSLQIILCLIRTILI